MPLDYPSLPNCTSTIVNKINVFITVTPFLYYLFLQKWRRRWFVLRQGAMPGQFLLHYYTDPLVIVLIAIILIIILIASCHPNYHPHCILSSSLSSSLHLVILIAILIILLSFTVQSLQSPLALLSPLPS